MAAKKKNAEASASSQPQTTGQPQSQSKLNDENAIYPAGAHFGIVQLPQDVLPKPSAQRIVQWVNRDGKLQVYITEGAYERGEVQEWFYRLMKEGYAQSFPHGGMVLRPTKLRIHWCRFTEDFLKTRKGERVNPETDQPEEA